MSSEQVKISVILPNYNSAKYIGRAINSFLEQDYSNKELIIVDAKSTDGSHEIINDFVSKNNNIRWIKEADRNVTDGINIGLKYCTGDFIAFLASDVFYYSNDLFSTINLNYKLVPFDGIYFDYYVYFPKTRYMRLFKCPPVEFHKNNLLIHGTIAGFDNVFISKEVYKKHQYNPDYNLVSDWEFFLRITQDFSLFMYVEKIGTINVQDGDNLSLKFQAEQQRQLVEVGNMYNTDHVKLFFDNDVQPPSLKNDTKQLAKRIIKKLIRR